jgi:hypothetical protein
VQPLSLQLFCNICDNYNCSAPTLQLLFISALDACLGAATTLQHLQLLCTYSAAYLSQSLLRLLDILQLARFVSF